MTVLRPKPVNGTMFIWHAPTRTYYIDMSQLGGFGRVYDDACDEGLTIISRFGTREAVCAVEDQHVVDGEVKAWILKPVKPKYKGADFTIMVFNT